MEELHTSILLPTELSTAATRIVELLAAELKHPFLDQLQNLVRKDVAALGAVLARARASEHTALLLEKDQARDFAYVALRDLSKSASRRSVPAIKAAGAKLTDTFQRHGMTLHRLGYAQESAKVSALVEELSSAAMASALAEIGGAEALGELRSAQAAFEEAFQNKVTDEARLNFPELAEARRVLGVDLTLLLDCVETLPRLDPPVDISAIEPKLDQIIIEAMGPARARRSREEAAAETKLEAGAN